MRITIRLWPIFTPLVESTRTDPRHEGSCRSNVVPLRGCEALHGGAMNLDAGAMNRDYSQLTQRPPRIW
jgi:hypothetical protein